MNDDGSNHRKYRFALIAIICLVALLVRFVGLATQCATMDEAVDLEIAASSTSTIVHEANSFPPLYHLLLKCWLNIFDGLFAARILSFMLGMGSIAILYALVADLVDRKTAFFSISLAAVSPLHVFYSQEARSYMLYFFLASLTIWTGLRLGRSYSKLNLTTFVGSAVIGAYTHYYFVLILVAVAIVTMLHHGKNRFFRFFAAAIFIGILSLPTVFLLKGDLDFQKNLRAPRPLNLVSVGYTFFSFASGYTLGPSRSQLHEISSSDALRLSFPWIIATAFAYGIPFTTGCRRLQKELIVWGGLLLVPLALIFLLCVGLGLTYNPRFAIWLWIPFALICSAGLATLSIRNASIFLLAIVFLSATALVKRHLDDEYRNEDITSVVSFLQSKPKLPTFVCSGYMAGVFRLLAEPSVQPIPLFDSAHGEGSDERAIRQIEGVLGEGCWFVYCRAFHGDPDGEVLKFVTSQNAELVHQAAGVKVFRIPEQNTDK